MIPDSRDPKLWHAYQAILFATSCAQAGLEFARPIGAMRYIAKKIGMVNLRDIAEPFRLKGERQFRVIVRPRDSSERHRSWPTPKKMLSALKALEFGKLVLELEDQAGGLYAAFAPAWELMGEDAVELSMHKKRWNQFVEISKGFNVIPVFELGDQGLQPRFQMDALAPRKAGRKPKAAK
jgi:hypothetical protein